MRKIIVGAFTSLDGVMQAPGGPDEDPVGGFRFGGWAAAAFDEKMGAFIGELFAKPFDLLLGRKTYDIFAAHWPYVEKDDPIGPLFDRIDKYVATRKPAFEPTWQNSHVLGPDAIAAVRKLKSGDGPDLLTQGSTEFLKALFENDLVDEIHVSVLPGHPRQGQAALRRRLLPARPDADRFAHQRHRHRHEPLRSRRRYRHRFLRIRGADPMPSWSAAATSPDGIHSSPSSATVSASHAAKADMAGVRLRDCRRVSQ